MARESKGLAAGLSRKAERKKRETEGKASEIERELGV